MVLTVQHASIPYRLLLPSVANTGLRLGMKTPERRTQDGCDLKFLDSSSGLPN